MPNISLYTYGGQANFPVNDSCIVGISSYRVRSDPLDDREKRRRGKILRENVCYWWPQIDLVSHRRAIRCCSKGAEGAIINFEAVGSEIRD